MDQPSLAERIVAAFDGMSPQLRAAARYVLDHPQDVALLSMREQAKRCGVLPATMTRFAKHLGYAGYEEIRATHADSLRDAAPGFAGKAGKQFADQMRHGEQVMAAEMLSSLSRQIEELSSADRIDRMVAAARALASARWIYCLGMRSSHPVSWHLQYVLRLIGKDAVSLDSIAGIGADPLATAAPEDILFVTSVAPYTRQSIDLAGHARGLGIPIVAVTDSEVAPLARMATHVILVPTGSPSFFHAMSPAFAVAEVLAALVMGLGGDAAVSALRRTDAHLAALDTYLPS